MLTGYRKARLTYGFLRGVNVLADFRYLTRPSCNKKLILKVDKIFQ